MQPWKMFVRSVSVVTVLTAGGFAAGQAVVPFANVSRVARPEVAVDEDTPDTVAPAVDPAAEVDPATDVESTDSSTTTTTEAPKPDPSTDPTDDPAPIKPPVADTPDEPATTTTTTSAPATPIVVTQPDEDVDCAALIPSKGDHNDDDHCDNGWHNKDGDWVTAHKARANDDNVRDARQPKKNGGRPATAPGHLKKNG